MQTTRTDDRPGRCLIESGRWLVACAALLVSAGVVALPVSTAVPGGIAVVDLGRADDAAPIPLATYRERPVMVQREDDHWYAIVGIHVDAETGLHQLEVTAADAPARQVAFEVTSKEYETQSLTIPNRRKVDPLPEDLERIGRERRQSRAAYRGFDATRRADTGFVWPVTGPISSRFGLRRILNGQPRNAHSGLDIAAGTGIPIQSPAAGRVVLTGDFFFNGNAVFIDHGQGLISMMCHMSRIRVEEGDEVDAGTIVGEVGATGRVTGPHLHWSVILNGNAVDPLLLLPASTP